jgi:hypothetical protein
MQTLKEVVGLGAQIPPSHGAGVPSGVHPTTFSPHVGVTGDDVDGTHAAPVATADTLMSRLAVPDVVVHGPAAPAVSGEHVLVREPVAQALELSHPWPLEMVAVAVQMAPLGVPQVQGVHAVGSVTGSSPPWNAVLVPWGHEGGVAVFVLS